MFSVPTFVQFIAKFHELLEHPSYEYSDLNFKKHVCLFGVTCDRVMRMVFVTEVRTWTYDAQDKVARFPKLKWHSRLVHMVYLS